MSIEEDVREFHRVVEIEQDILFNHLYEIKEYTWPIPSSDVLWFNGLKRYGKDFADLECELRETIVDVKIVKSIKVKYNKPKPLEFESVEDENGHWQYIV